MIVTTTLRVAHRNLDADITVNVNADGVLVIQVEGTGPIRFYANDTVIHEGEIE